MPRELSIHDLSTGKPITRSLYAVTGDLILRQGALLDDARIAAFVESGVLVVYMRADDEGEEDCAKALRFVEKDVSDLDNADVIGMPVNGKTGKLLLQAGKQANLAQRENLQRQGVSEVLVRRLIDDDTRKRTTKLCQRLAELQRTETTARIGKVYRERSVSTTRIFRTPPRADVEKLLADPGAEVKRTIRLDKTVRPMVEPPRLREAANEDDRQRIASARLRLYRRAREVFAALHSGRDFDGADIGELATQAVSELVADRHHRLFLAAPEEEIDYLTSHTLTTAVLAVNIASRMDYALEEIQEVAYAALLHDAGMARMPLELRDKLGPLTPAERRILETHSHHGFEICMSIRRLPASTPIAVYQENERLDGSGYPRGIGAARIHPFARIIAVAATYDALTRTRPYRKALHPYIAMKTLLNEVNGGRMDAAVVKALLETLSLFPIGSGVRLSDGREGYVLDARGPSYTRPVVIVLRDANGRALEVGETVDLEDERNAKLSIAAAVAPPFAPDDDDDSANAGAQAQRSLPTRATRKLPER